MTRQITLVLARPEALPASTDLRLVVGVDFDGFVDRMRQDYDDVSITPCRLI